MSKIITAAEMAEHYEPLIDLYGALQKIEAQAAEIERLAAENELLKKEVERRTYDGIHTCHDECQRVPCRQRREIEALQAQLKTVLDREAETHRRHDAKVEAQAAEIERIGQNVLMWLGTYRDDLSQKAIANLQSIARAALGETK